MSPAYEGTLRLVTEIILGASRDKPFIAAIDGRCGSGKTALAERLVENLACPVVHTDDFYLPPERRAPDWEKIPCANMDLMRLRQEVLEPFRTGRDGAYRPYDCARGVYGPERTVPAGDVLVVEGSYSHHKELAGLYDLKIFLTCSLQTQTERLRAREGERFRAFEQTWIPLEEAYIARYDIGSGGLLMDTTGWF